MALQSDPQTRPGTLDPEACALQQGRQGATVEEVPHGEDDWPASNHQPLVEEPDDAGGVLESAARLLCCADSHVASCRRVTVAACSHHFRGLASSNWKRQSSRWCRRLKDVERRLQ